MCTLRLLFLETLVLCYFFSHYSKQEESPSKAKQIVLFGNTSVQSLALCQTHSLCKVYKRKVTPKCCDAEIETVF